MRASALSASPFLVWSLAGFAVRSRAQANARKEMGTFLNSPLRGYQGADWYERFGSVEALQLLEEISSSRAAKELLDMDKMRSAIERWPSAGWADSRQIMIYRTRLPIALVTGVFLQEFEALSLSSPAS